jgi:hypothetical protein
MPSPKHPIRTPIQRHHVEPWIRSFTKRGQIFGVKFFKVDGKPRTMCARLGVRKNVKGTGKPLDRKKYPHLLTVFDMAKDEHRRVNIDTVQSVTLQGNVFYVVD